MHVRTVTVLVATIALALGLPAAGSADPLPLSSCGGTAPSVTSCSTGAHRFNGMGTLGFQFLHVPGYVGALYAELVWTSDNGTTGRRTVVCRFTGDIFQDDPDGDCDRSGDWPPGGDPTMGQQPIPATFTHNCVSYDLDAPVPGGSGDWYCYVDHT